MFLTMIDIVFIQVSGKVSYNECKLDNLNSHKVSAYISHYDLHTPDNSKKNN